MFRPQDGTRRLFQASFLFAGQEVNLFRSLFVPDGSGRQYWRTVLVALIATAVLVLSGPLVLTLLAGTCRRLTGFVLPRFSASARGSLRC